MTAEDILNYCHFYKGEAMMPESMENTNEGMLWIAERMICEEFYKNISQKDAKRDIASYVASYVSKWNPYELSDVMNTYLAKAPEQKDFIESTYL